MKKTKIFLSLCMALTILFGSTLTTFAEESTEDAESSTTEYYFDGYNRNDDGDIVVSIYSYFSNEGYSVSNTFALSEMVTNVSDLTNYVPILVKNWYKYSDGNMYFNFVWYVARSNNGTFDYWQFTPQGYIRTDDPSSSINGKYGAYFPSNTFSGKSLSTNIPIFENIEDAKNYILNNDESGLTNKKPEMDYSLYFKNVGYSVRANDSSENPDETYIKFTWDTDNLQSGDFLEIKTRNHYTKMGGDQVIGFHDYIVASNGVDCFSGSYEISQTDAVKAWFTTLDNKPLVFKDYDTDIYFIRPVRGNKLGVWTKIVIGRSTPTSSPYIKDIEYGNLDDNGDWIVSDDITISEGGNHGIDQGGSIISSDDAFNKIQLETIGDFFRFLFNLFQSLIGYFGDLPQLINAVIGWLPNPIIALICGGITVVILLRIFGR